jgi:hypothetical protein
VKSGKTGYLYVNPTGWRGVSLRSQGGGRGGCRALRGCHDTDAHSKSCRERAKRWGAVHFENKNNLVYVHYRGCNGKRVWVIRNTTLLSSQRKRGEHEEIDIRHR